jgi:hypothetical protein
VLIADPGSREKKAPDPGSGSAKNNLGITNPKNCYQALRNMIWDVYSRSRNQDPDFFLSRIPDPRVKKQRIPDPDPPHCSVFTGIAIFGLFLFIFLVTASFGDPSNFTVSEVEPRTVAEFKIMNNAVIAT